MQTINHLKKLVSNGVFALLLFAALVCNAQVKTLKGTILSGKDIDNFVLHQMDSLNIPGLSIAIIQNEKIVYYKAAGIKNEEKDTVDPNTVFEAASMTKPVFAYALLKLSQKGMIDLDIPLYQYYPYNDIDYDNRYKSITARMVLSHTTGFPNWRNTGGKLTINFEPGTKYGYSGEGFQYLQLVVSHITHKKIEDIIAQEVFAPFSMSNSFLIKNQYIQEHLADGMKDNTEWGKNFLWQEPNMAYSLCTEAKDYTKFVIELMKESRLSTGTFQLMSVPQVQSEPNKWSCLGIFMEQTPYGPKYSHSGNNNNRYNSNFEFYKDRGLGYVFFMNCHNEPAFTKRLNKFLETGK